MIAPPGWPSAKSESGAVANAAGAQVETLPLDQRRSRLRDRRAAVAEDRP